MGKVTAVPPRSKVKPADSWDLKSLFASDDAWDKAFREWESRVEQYDSFRGRLGESAAVLAECLKFDADFDRAGERLGAYAALRAAEDEADSASQGRKARYIGVASRAGQAASYIRPEILVIPAERIGAFLDDPALADFKLVVERLLRFRPHTLSPGEEKLLAMQTEMAQTAGQTFNQLNNADLKFGVVKTETGERIELSHGTYSRLLYSPDRSVRRKAFHQLYAEYEDHAHTLAATLNGSIHGDVYYARARNYTSALEAALFPDNVPVAVYDSLIEAVHRHLPALYRYYDVRRRAMKLKTIHHYDTYVPIITKLKKRHSWDQAVALVLEALQPLGKEYVRTLAKGIESRWCDKYENKGKHSGAFSYGTYDGNPYILMNYQPEVLDHVFTLAHEAGHSMHSLLSARHQPFQYYNYTIFVAEVASTFNEQLLSHHLLARARNRQERAYFLNREIDDIRGTIFRQTMFAEFEKITHALLEQNEPLTLDRFREEYRKLLELYFGPDFALDDELALECFRIPHFYRAFYVYKYATGMSAAIALAERVLTGGRAELEDYLNFLGSGCSKYPLELLRDAGVDMEKPEAVETALRRFCKLVDELDELL